VGFDGAQQLSCGNKTNAPGIPVAEFLKNLKITVKIIFMKIEAKAKSKCSIENGLLTAT
jgi:hypothetical protein